MNPRIPANGADHRPHFLDYHEDPYICGQCGHSCLSVENQSAHMHEEHQDFMSEAAELTGIYEGPQAVIDRFEKHLEVIRADPVTLLHKLQRDIAAKHISTHFKAKARYVEKGYADFLYQALQYLEILTLEYPSAPEIYMHIARSAQLLNRERLAADYWMLAVEIDAASDLRIVNDDKAISLTMLRLRDAEQSKLSFKYPYKKGLGGWLPGKISSFLGFGGEKEVSAWPSRRLLMPMIESLGQNPTKGVEQGFRSALTELREIREYNDGIFSALMNEQIYAEDLDLEELDRVHNRLRILQSCIKECSYFVRNEEEYWIAHIELYIAHRNARRSEIPEGIESAKRAVQLFIDFECHNVYPNNLPLDLIAEYGEGSPWNSVQALLTLAGLHSQAEDRVSASEVYESAVSRARELNSGIETIVLAMQKAAEFYVVDNPSRAVKHFDAAIKLLESSGFSLGGENPLNLKVLELKDRLTFPLELTGDQESVLKLRSEIEPFEGLITWRITGNLGD
jgi:hypothetical protein